MMSDNEQSSSNELLVTVREIWEAQRAAHATEPGAVERFFEYIRSDIEWTFPIGRYAGTHTGKTSFEEFFRFACAYYPTGLFYTLEKIYPVSEDTAAVEFSDEGQTVTGNPYRASVTIHYSVQGGQLIRYVEQFRAKNV